MSLKGRNWLFGRCLAEERGRTRLAFLSAKTLDLGLSGKEHTQGHILQACGATQVFLNDCPSHKRAISRELPTEPHELEGRILRDWLRLLSGKSGGYGRSTFGYNWNVLKSCLTRKYGGRCSGGGGGNNELEIVLRLMSEFI